MLITMKEMLNKAKEGKYGVAAANVWGDRSVKACFEAASKLRAPIIIAATSYVPMEEISRLVHHYAELYPATPVALNLDHGANYETAVRAVRAGFTSVMIDKSKLPFDENVSAVQEVVKMAHAVGVSVEAELGHVGQGAEYEETRDSGLTRKEEAVDFVEKTGVDCLAVAIGTSHGVYKGTPKIDLELLADLNKLVSVPLVLHGGSGTGDENLRNTVLTGIQKVNLSTDLSTAYLSAYDKFLKEQGDIVDENSNVIYVGNRTALCNNAENAGAKGYEETLMHYIKLFGGEGKEDDFK